jgi:hypothetical protein
MCAVYFIFCSQMNLQDIQGREEIGDMYGALEHQSVLLGNKLER